MFLILPKSALHNISKLLNIFSFGQSHHLSSKRYDISSSSNLFFITLIGFGLVEHERGKGFGFESLDAIMNWLNFQENVKVIKAECLISNKPSARILSKAGLKEIKRDDELIYWQFIKSAI